MTPDRTSPTGLVVVDKPGGMTSHDVVARARRTLGTRKVGHAGTLDPMATGVLVLGVGRATRLLGHLMLTEKTYAATIRLGEATTTDDAEGEVTERHPAGHLDDGTVRAALATFEGTLDQVPSTVSAIKVDGRRAYARVRDGEQVELAARQVTIHELAASELRPGGPDGDVVDLEVRLRCSSGTYVRALARDLGRLLGVGGHLTALRRHSVGPFGVQDANTDLDHLVLTPLADAARAAFQVHRLGEEEATAVRHGRRLESDLGTTGPVAVFDPDGEFLALYEQAGTTARAVAVFTG